MLKRVLLLMVLLVISVSGARAEGIFLERVRQSGVLTCAAEERPGFADAEDGEVPRGLAVDLCRAVAVAVVGPQAKIRFLLPEADAAFAALPGGAELVFLSPESVGEHRLAGDFVPGPVVFLEPIAVMVPEASAVKETAGLAGRTVCFSVGSTAQRAMEDVLGAVSPSIIRLGFREDVELIDAYNVGRCDALADDTTRLREMQGNRGINRLRSRVLAPALALTPVMAGLPASDGQWSATVGWVLQALVAGSAPESAWRGAVVSAPGLRKEWLAEVKAEVGTYGQMRDRNLGPGAWPNSAWPQGLLTPGG